MPTNKGIKKEFSKELLFGDSFIRINPDDKRIMIRKDCSACMLNYKYAKKHNKKIIYNLYTEGIIGVVMESNTKREI